MADRCAKVGSLINFILLLILLVCEPFPPATKSLQLTENVRGLREKFVFNKNEIPPITTQVIHVRLKNIRPGRKRYLTSRIQYTVNAASSFQMERLMMMSGDIEINPGPVNKPKTKYPCKECGKNVRSNQDAILCADCDTWSHAKCLGMSKHCFRYYLVNSSIDWTCGLCSLPKFNDSLGNASPMQQVQAVDVTTLTTTAESITKDDEPSRSTIDFTTTQQCQLTTLRNDHKNRCIIASLNINSLQNKFDEIKEWLDKGIFDILFIQETKIDRTYPNEQFRVDGYNMLRKDRVKGGGGTMAYVKETITATQKKKAVKQIEVITLNLQIGQRRFAVVSAYKPPKTDNKTFTDEMCTILDDVITSCNNILVIGDLNCDILRPQANKKEGRSLLDICDIYDLDSVINKPTRITKNTESCLDVILTNTPSFIQEADTYEAGLSDHKMVFAVLNTKVLKPKAKTFYRRTFKTFDQVRFCEDLSKVPFSTAFTFDDIDDIYWAWEKLYLDVLDEHAPVKSIKRRPRQSSIFLTPEIKKAINKRNRLKRIFNKTKNAENWENYRQLRNKVVSMRRAAVQNKFDEICKEKHANQKQFWKTIKPYINSRKTFQSSNLIVLKEGNKIIREQVQVAEILNDYYTGETESENLMTEVDLSLLQTKAENLPKLSLRQSKATEVREIMQDINADKATGYDGIPPRAIKAS